jgi:hypothetical protein
MGIPATVIAPDGAPETKLQAVARLGGRIIKVPLSRGCWPFGPSTERTIRP